MEQHIHCFLFGVLQHNTPPPRPRWGRAPGDMRYTAPPPRAPSRIWIWIVISTFPTIGVFHHSTPAQSREAAPPRGYNTTTGQRDLPIRCLVVSPRGLRRTRPLPDRDLDTHIHVSNHWRISSQHRPNRGKQPLPEVTAQPLVDGTSSFDVQLSALHQLGSHSSGSTAVAAG